MLAGQGHSQPSSRNDTSVEDPQRDAVLARLHGLRSSKEKLDGEIREAVRRAVAADIPYRTIGAHVGLSAQTIHNWIAGSEGC